MDAGLASSSGYHSRLLNMTVQAFLTCSAKIVLFHINNEELFVLLMI